MITIATTPSTMLREENSAKKQGNRKLVAAVHGHASSSSAPSRAYESATVLSPHFVPGYYDVICDRKRAARDHPGNVRFQELVQQVSLAYGNAHSKPERAAIVTDLVNSVRSQGTGFVKFDKKLGMWIEIGDRLAREKTGQQLRETLGDKYRSSQDSKRRARKAKNAEMADNLETIVKKNKAVSETVDHMKEEVPSWFLKPDQEVLNFFTDANKRMLNAMKQDNTLSRLFSDNNDAGTCTASSVNTESSLEDDDDNEHEKDDSASMEE